jgi:hypothetical protein
MNLQPRELIIWAMAIVLVVGTLIASPKDFTAAATIALALQLLSWLVIQVTAFSLQRIAY